MRNRIVGQAASWRLRGGVSAGGSCGANVAPPSGWLRRRAADFGVPAVGRSRSMRWFGSTLTACRRTRAQPNSPPAWQGVRSTIIVTGSEPWRPLELLRRRSFIDITLQAPNRVERQNLWQAVATDADPRSCQMLADRYQFSPGAMRAAVAAAEFHYRMTRSGASAVSADTLERACRTISLRQVSQFVRTVMPRRQPEESDPAGRSSSAGGRDRRILPFACTGRRELGVRPPAVGRRRQGADDG